MAITPNDPQKKRSFKSSFTFVFIALFVAVLIGSFGTKLWPSNNNRPTNNESSFNSVAPSTKESSPPANPAPGLNSASAPNEPSPQKNNSEAGLTKLNRESRQNWQMTREKFSGRLKTLEDGRWTLSPSAKDTNAIVENSRAFIEKYSQDLFGVPASALRFDQVVETDRSKVIFHEYIGNLRVLSGSLALVYDDGVLVRVQNDLTPATGSEKSHPVLDASQALSWLETNGTEKFLQDKIQTLSLANSQNLISPPIELLYFPDGEKLVLAYSLLIDRFASDGTRIDRVRVILDAESPHIIRTDKTLIH
jgi:hypothetical protein